VQGQHWKATLISILRKDYLLEDEQGLLAYRFWSLLFTQEINVKEETFGISSSSTSREDHEARHKSRHEVNKTPNNPRTEAST
jgi:hypothetical protein